MNIKEKSEIEFYKKMAKVDEAIAILEKLEILRKKEKKKFIKIIKNFKFFR